MLAFLLVLISRVQAQSEYLNLSNWTEPITTSSPVTQMWFDRGWIHVWGFNFEEAIRCFKFAIGNDTDCAMCHVGLVWAYGPNYNRAGGYSAEIAYNETQAALQLVSNGTLKEQALVDAVTHLTVKDGSNYNFDRPNYANAMRKVYNNASINQNDSAIAALFAKSLMELDPWEMWTKDDARLPSTNVTTEAKAVMELALNHTYDYFPLCHMYVHLMEQSNNPALALPHADHLTTSVPDEGHLRHMPSHIYIWTGEYTKAVQVNLDAIEADNKYVKLLNHTHEAYKRYRLHNYHFGIYAAMFNGQYEIALNWSNAMQDMIKGPRENFTIPGGSYMSTKDFDTLCYTKWQTLFRFGRWRDILAEDISQYDPTLFPGIIATGHFARTCAFAVLGQIDQALEEKRIFEQAVNSSHLANKKLQANLMWSVSGASVLGVGYLIMQGLIEHNRRNASGAEWFLRQAVLMDDDLIYAEPWGWMIPTRQTLGQVLLENQDFSNAESWFQQDLTRNYTNNIWGLNGLYHSLQAQNKPLRDVPARLNMANHSDIDINAAQALRSTLAPTAYNAASRLTDALSWVPLLFLGIVLIW